MDKPIDNNGRKDGYYVCQMEYDMIRVIAYWDSKDKVFMGCGIPHKESSYTYISTNPINIESNEWVMEKLT